MFAIELFPCSGGMAEGFRRAGVTFDLAFDKDPDACESYAHNHHHRPIEMDVRDVIRLVRAGWRPAKVIDLLVADPPCTPWSRAGKRQGIEDERDMLVETCDLIALLRPRAYLIGNVPGLNDAPSWKHVQNFIGGLQAHGYCVRDYAELDAADYGVPQHRVRPFWYGHLGGPCVRWPAPTHGPGHNLALGGMGLLPWRTCRDALSHLPLEEMGRPVRMRVRERGEDGRKNGGDASRCSAPDKPAAVVMGKADRKGGQIMLVDPGPATPRGRSVPGPGGDTLAGSEKHPASMADEPALTILASQPCNGGAVLLVAEQPRHPTSEVDEPARVVGADGGRVGKRATVLAVPDRLPDVNRPPADPDEPHRAVTVEGATTALLEWPWDRPSTTVARDERIPPPGHHDLSFSVMSGPNAIVLSEKAAGILQGFPDGWIFHGETKRARWSQIGQAMPPGLAEPVAWAIVDQIAATPPPPVDRITTHVQEVPAIVGAFVAMDASGNLLAAAPQLAPLMGRATMAPKRKRMTVLDAGGNHLELPEET